ncbi:hypothetical protein J6590_085318, partial [Homalodisca vitripennis]
MSRHHFVSHNPTLILDLAYRLHPSASRMPGTRHSEWPRGDPIRLPRNTWRQQQEIERIKT